MPVCSFCKNNYEFPRGTTVVQKDTNVKHYCTSKCRKNSEMGRLNKKVKWIQKSEVVKIENEKRAASKAAKIEADKKLKEEKKARKTKKKT